MGFYSILKIIKSVLYRTPKKILIFIVIALIFTILSFNSKSSAASFEDNVPSDSVTFYEYLDILNSQLDTGIIPTVGTLEKHTRSNFTMEFSVSPIRYFNLFDVNEDNLYNDSNQSSILIQSQNDTSVWWSRFNRDWSTQKLFNVGSSEKHTVFLNMYEKYLSFDGDIVSDFGKDFNIDNWYSSSPIMLNSNPDFRATSYKIYYIDAFDYLEASGAVSFYHKYYPASYDKVVGTVSTTLYGFYDIITNSFLVFTQDASKVSLGDVTTSPIAPDQPDTGKDYTQNLDNINNSINDMNNSINNSDVNAPIDSLPSDNTHDITESGFNQIFETIKATFTTGVAKDLVIEIPFTHKSFTINVANVYGNADLGIIKVLITAFWYYIFGLFIIKSISSKINKIKSGNIESIQDNNIKEDLL